MQGTKYDNDNNRKVVKKVEREREFQIEWDKFNEYPIREIRKGLRARC